MTVKFSENCVQQLNPNACKRCKSCGLYLNQYPAFDLCNQADIFWVGLSAVQFEEDDERLPLSANTRSGGLIAEAEKELKAFYTFYRTNIVKCLPLSGHKIRYPSEREMEKCFPNFEDEMSAYLPSVVFLLGKQVASFVLKQFGIREVVFAEQFEFQTFLIKNIYFVPIPHPSYILVYKRKFVSDYINAIHRTIRKINFYRQTCVSKIA